MSRSDGDIGLRFGPGNLIDPPYVTHRESPGPPITYSVVIMKNLFRLVVPALTFTMLMLCLVFKASAQTSSTAPWSTETIESPALGKRILYVATPDDYRSRTKRYPVLVMLDGNDIPMLKLFIAQAAYLADNVPGFPEFIVVGVANGPDRIYDMTTPATGSSIGMFKATGGAAAFAAFILDEVLPLVRSKYRTLPSTVLAGHSAGGLFGVYVAATRPGVFQGIIACSPSLWYNDSSVVMAYADMIAKSPKAQRLFASSGGFEHDIDVTTQHFARRLDSLTRGSATFSYHRYPDDTHSLTPMEGWSDGLRFIFGPLSMDHLELAHLDYAHADSSALEGALLSSEHDYAIAAGSLGIPPQLPEDILNSIGYRLLSRKRPKLGITVFERNVKAYPESVNVYDSLGDGFLAAGDTASAIFNFKLSVARARQTGVAVPEETRSKLDTLIQHR